MSTGFKPHLVREILGLGKEQFRYWRNNIDPTPSRPFFSTSDLLTYRVIKVLVLDKHISVKYLKNLDLTELFIYFQITKNSDLVDKYIMLDEENNIYKIISVEEIVSYIRNKIALINLRQVSEDHNKELEDFGKENNVVPISRNIRNFVKSLIKKESLFYLILLGNIKAYIHLNCRYLTCLIFGETSFIEVLLFRN